MMLVLLLAFFACAACENASSLVESNATDEVVMNPTPAAKRPPIKMIELLREVRGLLNVILWEKERGKSLQGEKFDEHETTGCKFYCISSLVVSFFIATFPLLDMLTSIGLLLILVTLKLEKKFKSIWSCFTRRPEPIQDGVQSRPF